MDFALGSSRTSLCVFPCLTLQRYSFSATPPNIAYRFGAIFSTNSRQIVHGGQSGHLVIWSKSFFKCQNPPLYINILYLYIVSNYPHPKFILTKWPNDHFDHISYDDSLLTLIYVEHAPRKDVQSFSGFAAPSRYRRSPAGHPCGASLLTFFTALSASLIRHQKNHRPRCPSRQLRERGLRRWNLH